MKNKAKLGLPYVVLIFCAFAWYSYPSWDIWKEDLYAIIGVHVALVGATVGSIAMIYKQLFK